VLFEQRGARMMDPRPARSPLARWASAATLAFGLLFVCTAVGWGHATFLRSDPPANARVEASPPTLRVWFSESVEPRFSRIEVLDAAGRRVDRGDSRRVPGEPAALEVSLTPLPLGLYVVTWETLSAVDGHVTRGSFSLAVGIIPPVGVRSGDPLEFSPAVILGVVTRWVGYLAGAAVVGLLSLWLLVLPPALRREAVLPLRLVLWTAVTGLAAAAAAGFLLQIAAVSRGAFVDTAGQLLLHTRYGVVWLARIALLVLFVPLVRLADRGRAAWLALAMGAAILLTTSLNSHAAAVGSAAAVVTDWLHLSAVSVWIGGLMGLVMVARSTTRLPPDPEPWTVLARIIARFSIVASVCVGTIIATGSYLLWLHAGSVEALIETWYGRSLYAKFVLAAPLLLLGAFNLLVIRPRLAAAAGRPDDRAAQPLAIRFRRAIRGEVILGTAVFLVAGLLGSLPPARQTYNRLVTEGPLEMGVRAADLRIAATVTPGRVGPNLIILNITGPGGPVDDAERVDARLTYLDRPLGTAIEPTLAHGGGEYIAHGPVLGLAGRWRLDVLVRRAGRDDVVGEFQFSVSRDAAASQTPASLLAEYPLPMLLLPLGFAVLVIAGILALTRVYG
jgi:copper transport protein